MEHKIVNVDFINENEIEDREVVVTLDNGTEVHICACYESWEQYGGTTDELRTTMPIAEKSNYWLHGGTKPNIKF